ncbi:striated muscle-specific serine/threonine-protein kinase-like [Mytilus trossulus]|uniref:striated muscle-specific serine/threonine-protein kinase-like n=1 Tax=Mytilus trossulus TaxID=6551 RepID=UPI00300476F5
MAFEDVILAFRMMIDQSTSQYGFDKFKIIENNTWFCLGQLPDDISVKVGESVSIRAVVDNATTVSWIKGAERVMSSSTSHTEEFDINNGLATLRITNARLQDDGDYTCAAGIYGSSKREFHHKIRLHVLPVKPEFIKELVDTFVNKDDHLLLEAKVNQAESITWQHNGKDLTPLEGKRKILFMNGKATLKICNATLKDAGEYICKARSKGATQNEVETTSICHVTVYALCPSFANVPGDQKFRNGTTFEIGVRVISYLKPTFVTWYKEGYTINKSERINMLYSNGVAKLKVYDSCSDDSGLYKCVAKNKHSSSACCILVKIESDKIEKQENVAECPVCMDNPPNKYLPCGHVICAKCMQRIGGVCPIDRAPFNINAATDLYLT